jgi:hypothetical protein
MPTTPQAMTTLATRPASVLPQVWATLRTFPTADAAVANLAASCWSTDTTDSFHAEVFAHPAGYSARFVLNGKVVGYLCRA